MRSGLHRWLQALLAPQGLEPWSLIDKKERDRSEDNFWVLLYAFSNILLQARYPRVDAERFLGQEAMAQEIEALGQAKAVLSGADFS